MSYCNAFLNIIANISEVKNITSWRAESTIIERVYLRCVLSLKIQKRLIMVLKKMITSIAH